MGETCSKHGEMKNAYITLVGKRKGRRPHGSRRCRFEDEVKMCKKLVGR